VDSSKTAATPAVAVPSPVDGATAKTPR
jgi:hypothetical protein